MSFIVMFGHVHKLWFPFDAGKKNARWKVFSPAAVVGDVIFLIEFFSLLSKA